MTRRPRTGHGRGPCCCPRPLNAASLPLYGTNEPDFPPPPPCQRFEAQSQANEARARQLDALYGSSSSGSDSDSGSEAAAPGGAAKRSAHLTAASAATKRPKRAAPPAAARGSPLRQGAQRSSAASASAAPPRLRRPLHRKSGSDNDNDDDDDDDDDDEAFEAFRREREARRQHPRRALTAPQGAASPAPAAAAAANESSDDEDAGALYGPGSGRPGGHDERPCIDVPATAAREPIVLWSGRDPQAVRHTAWQDVVQFNPWELLYTVTTAVPAATACRLRPYQKEGVQRMAAWFQGRHGGLLSDAPVRKVEGKRRRPKVK